ncbi:universal stress protein [Pricia sp. S334]|uniref:Universal stress protein n=1 Tax=Pricia mediterranea TaxID=3076079 RepID=A0ABU3L1L0_9FLAO|nr:universal stress protein [Pricia sp. S334]MDT7827606.1 universal stress protein [Pricia sp. S334]
MQIQTLVVPVDFSDTAEKAVHYATALAKKLNSELIFAHGYTPVQAPNASASMSSTNIPPAQNVVTHEELARQRMEEFLDGFPEISNTRHTVSVMLGSITDVVRETVREKKVDLVVTATEGADELKGFFVGTNSEKLSREAPCPVLIVPDDVKNYKIDTVCLALDTKDPENSVSPELLMALVNAFDAKLRIIHISEDEDTTAKKTELIDQYQNTLGKTRHSFHVFHGDNPQDGITKFLDENPIDLLTLVHREHGFFERIFQPGIRKKLVFSADIPLLILK